MSLKKEDNYKKWILEAIDHLRNRKARPDTARICNYVVRHYRGTSCEIEANLAQLVESEDIIRVAYKGSISYRNAHAPKKKENRINILNTRYASTTIKKAIICFEKEDPSLLDTGVSRAEIEKWLIANGDDEPYFIDKYLTFVLRQLVNDLVLFEADDDIYTINRKSCQEELESVGTDAYEETTKASPSDDSKLTKVTPRIKGKANAAKSSGSSGAKMTRSLETENVLSGTSQSVTGVVKSKRGRPPGKRKRIKKSHGPDFVEENYGLRVDSQCDYCLSVKNKGGNAEGLIYCKDCNAKAHPSCMKYSEVLARRARNSPWQCIDCKTCYVCEDSGDADMMLFCDACDKGYHMNCHNPPLTDKPQGKWVCGKCVLEGTHEQSDDIGSNSDVHNNNHDDEGLQYPHESPTTSTETIHTPPKLRHLSDSEVPDASDWGIIEVSEFFKSLGFLEQAESFKEQEIDGRSLLLLKRTDVLTGLSLKLGPALKIYTYVQRLQLAGGF